MAAADRPVARPRPVYLNLIAIRLPLPAIVSILHRITGALLFLVGIPLLLWFIQRSLASPDAFEAAMRPLKTPLGKLVLFGLTWGTCSICSRACAIWRSICTSGFNLRRRAVRPLFCSCCR